MVRLRPQIKGERAIFDVKAIRDALLGSEDILHRYGRGIGKRQFQVLPPADNDIVRARTACKADQPRQNQYCERELCCGECCFRFSDVEFALLRITRGWCLALYGTPGLFSFSHEFFDKALMYLGSRFYDDETLSIEASKGDP